jgi:hypothetical protein
MEIGRVDPPTMMGFSLASSLSDGPESSSSLFPTTMGVGLGVGWTILVGGGRVLVTTTRERVAGGSVDAPCENAVATRASNTKRPGQKLLIIILILEKEGLE